MTQHTVVINGIVYDQHTGKPLSIERSALAHPDARTVHNTLQRSTTLQRKYVSKPAPASAPEPRPSAEQITVTRTAPVAQAVAEPATASQEVAVHTITKFAPHPVKAPATPRRVISDVAPGTVHPVAKRAVERQSALKAQAAAPAPVVKPSQVLKNEAIADALTRTANSPQKKEHHQKKQRGFFQRALSVGSASLALLLLGGYLTYLSMPNISTRVAAAQAGINASYPSYRPSGYSLSGPVTFQQGAVTMKFAANGAPVSYTFTQSRSGWDSTAVLDNYVMPKVGENFSTTTAGGLTIYTFGRDAAWVSGGILYTISGNANLSNDQLRRIATSV